MQNDKCERKTVIQVDIQIGFVWSVCVCVRFVLLFRHELFDFISYGCSHIVLFVAIVFIAVLDMLLYF